MSELTISLVAIFSFVAIYMILDACDNRQMLANCAGRRVVSVGGCDRWGDCGVVLDDGRKIRMHMPAVGEKCP